jgi:hypothetical protein
MSILRRWISQRYGISLTAVVMKDELIDIRAQSENFIINIQSSTEGNGTRWVVAVIRGKNYFYQDSFGITPPTEIIDFRKRIKGSRLAFLEMESQHLQAESSGWYACGLLIHISRNPQKELYKVCGEYINIFDYNTSKNNAILKSFFRNLPLFYI